MPETTEQRAKQPEHVLLDIRGMHCAGCASRVERTLVGVEGVATARVNLLTNQASVAFDPRVSSGSRLIEAVTQLGFKAAVVPLDAGPAADDWWERQQAETAAWRQRFLVGGALLLPLVLFTHGGAALAQFASPWLLLALAVPLQFYLGWPYFTGALRALRHGAANMDTLVSLGTGTAFVAGVVELLQQAGHHIGGMYLGDAGMILTFVTLGKYLEGKAKGRASAAIRRLLDLTPLEATVLREAATLQVPVRGVMVGETILVRPGDRVPLDAQVLSGISSMDQAWLTGEPTPVDKQPGDEILAGTINGSGSLTARVTRPAGQTALARVIELVRRAQESKTEVGRLADVVVAWFVPAVLTIAGAAFAVWGLVAGDWSWAISSAVAVLVVACPCALGLATPTAILVGSTRGAQCGILIKEARALEIAGRLTTVILDKTGTVSLGRPAVVDVAAVAGVSIERVLGVAAAVERLSRHPLAETIVAEAAARGIAYELAQGLEVVAGQGVRAQRARQSVLVGNPQLLAASGVEATAAAPAIEAAHRLGQTALLVAEGARLLGWIVLADPLAPTSREAVAQLQALGLDVRLLSGDSRAAVEAVAATLGIRHVTAEVLPEEKQRVVRTLQQADRVVAVVGDGINDAPALAAADLGIAIGSGSDVAIEAAEIVLVGSDLRKVAQAIVLSRATLRTIRQNLVWALVYNILLLPLAAGVLLPLVGLHLPPTAAAAAMAASSVSVVTNSLLLRRRKL